MDHPQHTLVVSCLVRNVQREILMVRHQKRGWELPQGRVEEGEGLLAALHREVLEETGVTITEPTVAAVWSKLTEPVALIHGFVAEFAAGVPTPSEETPEVVWVLEAEARKRIGHPINRDRLSALLSFEGTVKFYSYTTSPYRRQPECSSY
jgi:8-oxo-dGTP diphosphatase